MVASRDFANTNGADAEYRESCSPAALHRLLKNDAVTRRFLM